MAEKTKDELDDLERTQTDKNESEYVKTVCEINERLSLCNKRVRACDELLCRPLRIFCKSNLKRSACEVEISGVPVSVEKVNKQLNISRRSDGNKILNIPILCIVNTQKLIGYVCRYFWCHKSNGVAKQPNEKS